ncbi:MAG: MlaD family protein [Planctomycetota bacterium]
MKKKNADHRLRVGLTLSAGVLLLFALVFSLNGMTSWFGGYSVVEARFPQIDGLRAGDPVQFHGLYCGVVRTAHFADKQPADTRSIAFAEEHAPSPSSPASSCEVVVELEVSPAVRRLLRSGSVATIEKTLTGVTLVNLLQGTGAALTANEQLTGQNSVSMNSVTEQMLHAAAALTRLLGELEPVARDFREQQLHTDVLLQIVNAAEAAQRVAATIDNTISENRPHFRASVAGAEELVGRLDGVSAAANEFLTEARDTTEELGQLSQRLNYWFAENRGYIDHSLENVADATGSMKGLAAELRRRPWRLLHSPSESEALALDTYESSAAYVAAATETRRAIDRVRELLECGPDDPTIREFLAQTLTTLEADLSRASAFQAAFWERLAHTTP